MVRYDNLLVPVQVFCEEILHPPATECSLLDWMERFNWDYPPSLQKPKPYQEMTEDEKLSFIMLLIWNDLACVKCRDHHRETWSRRNNLDPKLENASEPVLKHSSSATAPQHNHHALVSLLSKFLYYKLINQKLFL